MARYGHTPPIQGYPSETPSGGHPWDPLPGRPAETPARGARGAAGAPRRAARRPARGGSRVGRKWPFPALLVIQLYMEMAIFGGFPQGSDLGRFPGCQKMHILEGI